MPAAAHHLNQFNFPAWEELAQKTRLFFNSVKHGDSAYDVSIPLLAASLLGDQNLYREIAPRFIELLEGDPLIDPSERAWLYGRALRAAQNVGDTETFQNLKFDAEVYLKDCIRIPGIMHDPKTCWGLSYFAGLGAQEYEETRKVRDKTLQEILDSRAEPSEKMWCIAMEMDAAARVGDRDHFRFLLTEMQDVLQQDSTAAAVTNCVNSNDYPFWLTGNIMQAAAIFGSDIYDELDALIPDLCRSAKDNHQPGDYILGSCTHAMAAIRKNEFDHPEAPSTRETRELPPEDREGCGPLAIVFGLLVAGYIYFVIDASQSTSVADASPISRELELAIRIHNRQMSEPADPFEPVAKWVDRQFSRADAAVEDSIKAAEGFHSENPAGFHTSWIGSAVACVSLAALLRRRKNTMLAQPQAENPPTPPQ